jgi:hypothetical protein
VGFFTGVQPTYVCLTRRLWPANSTEAPPSPSHLKLEAAAATWGPWTGLRYHLGPLSSVSPRCGTTNNAQARPLEALAASRAAELRGGLWRSAVGKTGRLSIEWGATVELEHTEWGACAEHARLQLNDNDN